MKGFLGTGIAWSYVHETNGRKSLHFHASLHGGACPALLGNVVGIQRLEAAVTAALDSMYTASVPLDVHAIDSARRALRVRGVRCTFLPSPAIPRNEHDHKKFLLEATFRGILFGCHEHQDTCHKIKSIK